MVFDNLYCQVFGGVDRQVNPEILFVSAFQADFDIPLGRTIEACSRGFLALTLSGVEMALISTDTTTSFQETKTTVPPPSRGARLPTIFGL